MKTLKTKHLENSFQELQVFEDQNMNDYCDQLMAEIYDAIGMHPVVVGSVAKLLSGEYQGDYKPKDVDFALDIISYRKLLSILCHTRLFAFAKMVEIRPERIIIYTDSRVIELWCFISRNYNEKKTLYKNKITYLWQ